MNKVRETSSEFVSLERSVSLHRPVEGLKPVYTFGLHAGDEPVEFALHRKKIRESVSPVSRTTRSHLPFLVKNGCEGPPSKTETIALCVLPGKKTIQYENQTMRDAGTR